MKPGLPVWLRSLMLAFVVSLVMQSVSGANPSRALSAEVKLVIPINADSPAVWSEAIAGAPC